MLRRICALSMGRTHPPRFLTAAVIPDVLDIAITKDLVFPVYLTTCSVMSSDHLRILIDTQCRSSFLKPPDRPDLKRTDWPKYQASLESVLPSNPDFSSGVPIHACVKELTSAISKALSDSTPKYCPRADPRPPLTAHIQKVMH